MALILDKSYTGVTSVDESGNTLTTGYTYLTYTDKYGNVHDNPYMVVDNFIIDKLYHEIRVTISIYKDYESRNNEKEPIHFQHFPIQNNLDLYNKYFTIENMDNNNVFKASYEFIQFEYFTGWKSDES
jgi:hypothetical protein